MTNPGKMDRRIAIQRRTITQDAAGGNVETWSLQANAWAEKVDQHGKESEIANADRAEDETQFRVRYKSFLEGVTSASGYRITYKGQTFDITHVKEGGRRDTQLITSKTTEGIS